MTDPPSEIDPSCETQHLLLVDDDLSILTLLSEFAEGLGYKFRIARDGEEALARLEEFPATILITDLLMPRMDGVVLLKLVKERWPEMDVIVITGFTKNFRYTDVIKAGASDFLQKPFNLDELEAKLDRVVRERNLRSLLKRLAVRDALTDLFNRRHFEEKIEEETERASRQGYPLFLLMLDIDRFKGLNDRLGHHAGDEVLKILSALLVRSTRRHVDTQYRFGGDEFAVIIPQATEEQARRIAERIRASYLSEPVNGTTLSLGIARFERTGGGEIREDIDRLIRSADDAMYAAKRSGGNCVVVYGEGGTPADR